METRANVSKQGSSGGNYETTNQLIGLLLINEECRRRWVQEQQPSIESFPSHYGLLLAAILERQGEKLTWQYFADFMKARNISKIERQGQEHQYNILAIAKPNPADFDVFAKRMTGEKMREEVSKAILPLAQVAKSKDPSQVRAVAEEMIAAADKAEVKAEPNEDQLNIVPTSLIAAGDRISSAERIRGQELRALLWVLFPPSSQGGVDSMSGSRKLATEDRSW